MAKKKTKVVSNRGFATTSAPSKKIEPEVSKVEEKQPEPKKEPKTRRKSSTPITPEESVSQWIDKHSSLNEYKAEESIKKLDKIDAVAEEKSRDFRITSDTEQTLLQLAKHEEAKTALGHPCVKTLEEKHRCINQLDVIYRVLVKIGFEHQDVEASLKATPSVLLDDHLDWLCLHVPYDRMPIGFFDKYFDENEKQEHRIKLQLNQSNAGHIPITEAEEKKEDVVVKHKSNDIQASADDQIKLGILEAAQTMEEENEEDIHEIYAQQKLKMVMLQALLPSENSGKKKKKNRDLSEAVPLSAAETEKTMKEIKKLKDRLSSLEADWDFNKSKAEALYAEYTQLETQKQRQQAQEQAKQKSIETKEVKVNHDATDTQESEDEGGLFGGMLMTEEEEQAIASSPAVQVESFDWRVIDLSLPKSYVGRFPKDLLLEYCNKHKLLKQTYHSTNMANGIWRATLKIQTQGYNHLPMTFELPEKCCASTKLDAEQLVAFHALFELDSDSSVHKVLPTAFKDLWNEWAAEKKQRMLGPQLEAEKKKASLLFELVESVMKNKGKVKTDANHAEDEESKDHADTSFNHNSSKQHTIFSRVQSSFRKRLDDKNYREMKEKRQQLPISAYQDHILELIQKHQVIIISGETGCGKSTQVPQFLAEHLLLGSNQAGSVICTQPRRISAISIANRVSIEMGDQPKSTGSRNAMVGYQIRLESKASPENVLFFCTTGILLRRLESDKHLKGVSFVVVDEVHERTMESDFLIIILKRLCIARPDLKIILMSATVEADRFSSYFNHCPVVSVPGRTFPVHAQYLEDVIESTGYVVEEDSHYAIKSHRLKTDQGTVQVSGLHGSTKRVHYEMFEEDSDDEDPYDPTRIESKLTIVSQQPDVLQQTANEDKIYSRQTRKMLKRLDDKKINNDLILQLLDYIYSEQLMSEKHKSTKDQAQESLAQSNNSEKLQIPDKGAILIFLPGMNEIRRLYDIVSSHPVFGDPTKFLLIALHSTLSSEHQEKAFDIPPEGVRKIVFSTNIAETGVTISDVTIVIDTGMARVVSYDDKKRVTRLLQKHIAKANVRQRRGRAGRVQEGVCFHLFSKQKFEEMPDFELPEILRLPLEELCLRIKVCRLGSIRKTLEEALDRPDDKMIENAIQSLQEVQALTIENDDEVLTPLGSHLSNLPVDVHMGKMIIFGALFRCLDPILTIAASLSFKSPFIRPFGKEDEADTARARFQTDNSDFLTIYKAYSEWRRHLDQLRLDKTLSNWSIRRKMTSFCKDNYLSEQNLEMIEDMKRQYLGLLISIGFVKPVDDAYKANPYEIKRSGIQLCQIPSLYNMHASSVPVINAALTAGLYPKVAEFMSQTKQIAHKNLSLEIHPSSILFQKEHTFTSEFLIYNTVVMNNSGGQANDRVYMWETATVDPIAIVLLSTHMNIKYKQRQIILDNWLYFKCFARTAVLLKFIRKELNKWLEDKMNQPDLDLTTRSERMLNALTKTLETCSMQQK
ncbi:P-loop containing nucleoside triphosphate hydrolase protein [Blakeslea trispora]|nr:P-loop containing nucleoside triphosphate hydrolase protein [Blakeslea trispora]